MDCAREAVKSATTRNDEVAMSAPTPSEIELKRLRWRCRRGMRELDQLFDRYLDTRLAIVISS